MDLTIISNLNTWQFWLGSRVQIVRKVYCINNTNHISFLYELEISHVTYDGIIRYIFERIPRSGRLVVVMYYLVIIKIIYHTSGGR